MIEQESGYYEISARGMGSEVGLTLEREIIEAGRVYIEDHPTPSRQFRDGIEPVVLGQDRAREIELEGEFTEVIGVLPATEDLSGNPQEARKDYIALYGKPLKKSS